MKAYILHSVNNLSYEDTSIPKCPSGWAIVKVKATGICSSDISRVFRTGTYHYPTIIGHEFAGIVHSVGTDSDFSLIGKHVGVFPLIPCRKCRQCENKKYEMCENYDYVGSRRDGGFAEYVAVPVWNLIQLPENISFTNAAMLEPLSVGLHAVKMLDVQEGDSVAVIGTGMIGISAAQWAKRYNAENVTVLGRNESKRELVEKCGLEYRLINDLKDKEFDKVIEAVGSPESIYTAINIVAAGGTLVLMGNPSGDIFLDKQLYWRILRKQITVKGTWNSSYDGVNRSDWTEAVEALEKHFINVDSLISHVFNQERLMEGLVLMNERKEPFCKVMTTWNDEEL